MLNNLNPGDWMMLFVAVLFIGTWGIILLGVRKYYFLATAPIPAKANELKIVNDLLTERLAALKELETFLANDEQPDSNKSLRQDSLRVLHGILKKVEMQLQNS